MRTATLEFNPVTRECRTLVGGAAMPYLDQKYSRRGRLQGWAAEYARELAEFVNDESFVLSFKGTAADHADLVEVIRNVQPEVSVEQLSGRAHEHEFDHVWRTFGGVLANLRESLPTAGGRVGDSGSPNSRRGISPGLESRAQLVNDVEAYLEDSRFQIAVIAPMSCGKSTLVNAMLGRRLLATGNRATTAIVTYVHDRDGKEDVEVRALDADGEVIRQDRRADHSVLRDINASSTGGSNDDEEKRDRGIACVHVDLDIPWITNCPVGHLVLVDTPGPNNAANQHHHATTYGLIQNATVDDGSIADLVLYVLDYTKLETDDDHRLLSDVAAAIHEGGIAASDRFIFVVNRVDGHDEEDDGELSEGAKRVAQYLRQFGVANPTVFFVDARGALLARRSAGGEELTGKAAADYENHLAVLRSLKTHDVARCSGLVKEAVLAACRARAPDNRPATEDPCVCAAQRSEELLCRSGLLLLEENIRHFMAKYWIPLKLQRVFRRLDQYLVAEREIDTLRSAIRAQERAHQALEEEATRLRAICEHAEIGESLAADLKRSRQTAADTVLPCLRGFQKQVDRLLDKWASAKTMNQRAADAKLRTTATAMAELAGRLQAQHTAEVQELVQTQVDALTDDYLDRVDALLADGEFSVPLPKVKRLVGRDLRTRALQREHAYTDTEERTRVVTKTRAWYNPKRWFGNKTYKTEEKYQATIHLVRADALYRDLKDKMSGLSHHYRNKSREAVEAAMDAVERDLMEVVATVRVKLTEMADVLARTEVDSAGMAERLESSRLERQLLERIRDEVVAAARGPFSC